MRVRAVQVMLAGMPLLLSSCALMAVRAPGSERTYVVGGPSMESTFQAGERIRARVVDDYTPRRGDVVVFEPPEAWGPPDTVALLVKRVVAVGGDSIACCDEDGDLILNGRALDENSYLDDGSPRAAFPFSVSVPEGHLWLMGDNRKNSLDSAAISAGQGGAWVPESAVVAVYVP